MIAYKTILNDIGLIFANHNQINSFGFGSLSQITMDIENHIEPEYTRAYVVPGNVTFNTSEIFYDFSIIIADRLEDDLSNQQDVMNDTHEIAKDIFTILVNSYSNEFGQFTLYYEPDYGASIIPFLERFETVLGGWTLNITIRQELAYNSCIVPTDTLDLPTGSTTLNYKQILSDILEIGDKHLQVNSTGYGDLPQLTNDITTDVAPLYPKMYVIPTPSTLNLGQINHTFDIYVMDKLEEDYSNQLDVMSDNVQICLDIFATLNNSHYESNFGVICAPLIDNFDDVLAGWQLNIDLNISYAYDRCEVPVESFDKLKWYQVDTLWNALNKLWNKV